MAKKPFFSVIIPTLNEEKYLPKLLESLSRQTYKDFEVIVADGESEDKTVTLAKQFSGKIPLLTILSISKRGAAHQRNMAAKKAKGQFIASIDGDIVTPPDFLERIHYTIVTKGSKFLTTWMTCDSEQTSDKLVMTLANMLLELSIVIGKPFACGACVIIERNLYYKVGGYREDMATADDFDFTLRVCKTGTKLTTLKEPKYVFSMRRHHAQGRQKTLLQYAHVDLYYLLTGTVPKEKFDYQTGGHLYSMKDYPLRVSKRDLQRYREKFEQLQQRLITWMKE